MPDKHVAGPLGLQVALSSDHRNIRYINADLGDSYSCIAEVRNRKELTLDQNIATAKRLVTSYNACEGIPSIALEHGAVNKLLSACEKMLEAWDCRHPEAGIVAIQKIIAEIKGE